MPGSSLTDQALKAILSKIRGKAFSPELITEFRKLLHQRDLSELETQVQGLKETVERLKVEITDLTEHVNGAITDLFKNASPAEKGGTGW